MEVENIPRPNPSLTVLKTFLLLFVLLLPLLIISELINKKALVQKKATGGNPSFSFSPATLNVNPGQEFLVEIKINTPGQQTSGGSIQVVYNKDIFEAKEITPPLMLPTVLRKKIDNQVGKLFLDAGVEVGNPQYFAGEGVFGKIKFKVKPEANAGNKTIAFFLNNPGNPAALGDCDIIGTADKVGQDLLAEVNNLNVTIISPITPTSTPVPTTPFPTFPPGQPTATQTPTEPPTPTTSLGQPTNTPYPTQPPPTSTPFPTSTPKPTLPPFAPDLAADISGPTGLKDKIVDIYDFNALMVHWEETQNISQFDISGPQNQPDGKIDFYDLVKVLTFWSP